MKGHLCTARALSCVSEACAGGGHHATGNVPTADTEYERMISPLHKQYSGIGSSTFQFPIPLMHLRTKHAGRARFPPSRILKK